MNFFKPNSLDFDELKGSFISFLKENDELKDINFEGSNANILLDILMNHAHYMGLMANMQTSELFLESAQLRSSVVSRAKDLGYIGKSVTSAQATVQVEVTPEEGYILPTSLKVPKYTTFTGSSSSGEVKTNFLCKSDSFLIGDGTYLSGYIELVEGKKYDYRFTPTDVFKNAQGKIEYVTQFVIPSAKIDATTLEVFLDFNDGVIRTAERITSVNDVTSFDKYYYLLEETPEGTYQIRFGDDVLFRSIPKNSIVSTTSVISKAEEGNGFSVFSCNNLLPNSTQQVYTIINASNGSDKESIDSIKLNARYGFSSQKRSVSALDYKQTVISDFPSFRDVIVWGGEENVPPMYGKVFVSIVSDSGTRLPDFVKQSVIDKIREKSVLTVKPEIVDPEITKVGLTIKVRYDPRSAAFTNQQSLSNDVIQSVIQYDFDELSKFGKSLKFSRLLSAIDNSNDSIQNSLVSVNMIKYVVPKNSVFTINFPSPIKEGTVNSSAFLLSGNTQYYIEDELGKIFVYSLNNQGAKIRVPKVYGTVDYDNGVVSFSDFPVAPISGKTFFELTAEPVEYEIEVGFNQILTINDSQGTKIAVNLFPISKL